MRAILISFLFSPIVLISQSIQFNHDYRVFAVEENDTDTFQLRLSSLPSGNVTVTLSASGDDGLFTFSPSQLTFTPGNYNSYQDVYITADSTPAIDAVRTTTVTATASGGGYDGVTLNESCYLRERMGDVIIWMIGDPHIGTDLAETNPTQWNGVQEAIQDFRDGQDSVERLNWDIAICVGDITGFYFDHISGELSTETDGIYAGRGIGYVWREIWNDNGIDVNSVYTVAGNHDGGDTLENVPSNQYIDLYLDPWGEFTSFSGINNNSRPYPVTKHRKDIGSFSVGSVRFVLIHDRNDAKWPAGKNTIAGHPAGTYTKQAISIFDSLIENSPQQTIIGVAHHLLENTTTYTAYGEEEEVTNTSYGLHGNHGWLDIGRGSYAAVVWDESMDFNDADAYVTYDGKNLDQSDVTPPNVGFKISLENQIDHHVWLAGHTHPANTAWDTYNGRAMAVKYDKSYSVVNCGTLTKYHGPNFHQYSRILHLYEGYKTMRMQTFTHVNTTVPNDLSVADQDQRGRVIRKGVNDDLEMLIPLNTCFDSYFDATNQNVRGNCPSCNN